MDSCSLLKCFWFYVNVQALFSAENAALSVRGKTKKSGMCSSRKMPLKFALKLRPYKNMFIIIIIIIIITRSSNWLMLAFSREHERMLWGAESATKKTAATAWMCRWRSVLIDKWCVSSATVDQSMLTRWVWPSFASNRHWPRSHAPLPHTTT